MSFIMDDETTSIVLDNGSGTIRAGFAGDDEPRTIFPTIIGRSRDTPMAMQASQVDSYIGAKALDYREISTVSHPIEHGIITNWDDMEAIWQHIFNHALQISLEEHPLLITESSFSPIANREKTTQLLFEHFNAPAMYLANQAVLSFYYLGRTAGVVLESGDGVTQTMPINEGDNDFPIFLRQRLKSIGYAVPNAVSRLDFAGRDVTHWMIRLLAERGYSFASTIEREIVRQMKEELCYVALDFEQELAVTNRSNSRGKNYTLPDGQQITMGNESFRCPEALFIPTMSGRREPGLAQLLNDTIMKCDIDLRSTLYCNCLLSGGNTKFEGFADRMKKEMSALVRPETRVRLVAPADRENSTWIGGSILGSLSTFQAMWILKKEYDDFGPSIVHRKCCQP